MSELTDNQIVEGLIHDLKRFGYNTTRNHLSLTLATVLFDLREMDDRLKAIKKVADLNNGWAVGMSDSLNS